MMHITAEVLDFLATLATPEEIIALRPSEALQVQISNLLEKNRSQGLTPAEEQIWEQYQYLEHLIRMVKAKAYLKLKRLSQG
jgi:uracil-DNA glycosylase